MWQGWRSRTNTVRLEALFQKLKMPDHEKAPAGGDNPAGARRMKQVDLEEATISRGRLGWRSRIGTVRPDAALQQSKSLEF